MNHVMIDIETPGIKPYSVILSIGAVMFNLDTGETGEGFYDTIDKDSCERVGLKTDESTLDWWSYRPEEIRKEAFSGRSDIFSCLVELSSFFKKLKTVPVFVWANSPSFDCSLLRNAHELCDLPVPWSFRSERDFRTVLWITPVEGHQKNDHNALNDCYNQIDLLCTAYNRIKGLS